MAEFNLPAELLALFENDPTFEAMLNVMIKNNNSSASRLIFWSLSLFYQTEHWPTVFPGEPPSFFRYYAFI